MTDTQRPQSALDLLVFEVSGLRFGLELSVVREVVRAVLITPLPEAPAVVEGIVDVRGDIVPVYDLRARFGLPPRPLRPDDRMVIAWTGERLVCVRCDLAEWIEQVATESVDRSAPLLQAGGHIAGVAKLPDGLVLIQDLRAFLDQAEAAALDEALSAHDGGDAG